MIESIPEELILHILYFTDPKMLCYLSMVSKKIYLIVKNNYKHICRNFKNLTDRNFYNYALEKEEDIKKFMFLNYDTELERNKIIKLDQSLGRDYSFKCASKGFSCYKNYLELLSHGYCGFYSSQASETIDTKLVMMEKILREQNFCAVTIRKELKKYNKKQIFLMKILKKSYYYSDHSSLILLSNLLNYRLSNIESLIGYGFCYNQIADLCNRYSRERMEALFNLKEAGFFNNPAVRIINNFDAYKINRILTMKNMMCPGPVCLESYETFDLDKLDLMIKIKIKTRNSNWINLYNLVNDNSVDYLNNL